MWRVGSRGTDGPRETAPKRNTVHLANYAWRGAGSLPASPLFERASHCFGMQDKPAGSRLANAGPTLARISHTPGVETLSTPRARDIQSGGRLPFRQLGRPRAVPRRGFSSGVIQLLATVRAPEHQTTTAHVTPADEVGREQEP